MKSPVKENINNFRCGRVLQELIPKGSVVDSYLLFGGQEELNLAERERFVIAHTTQYIIYEFWDCALSDPHRIVKIANDLYPKIQNVNMFAALQESWTSYSDPYLRATLFFLLNKCSSTGLISCGELDEKNWNPISLSHLKKFKIDNFHLAWDEGSNFIDSVKANEKGDYLLLPVGKFNYNLFEYGKSKGYEMTTIYHQRLYDTLETINNKWILMYKYHSRVATIYKGQNIIMVDKYGRETKQKENCEDLVIANF